MRAKYLPHIRLHVHEKPKRTNGGVLVSQRTVVGTIDVIQKRMDDWDVEVIETVGQRGWFRINLCAADGGRERL